MDRFDAWIRGGLVDLNTELEEAYFAARATILHGDELDRIKQTIAGDGAKLVGEITALPAGSAERYELLGLVGHYLSACRRHEVDGSEAWPLASRLGLALGVAPRLVFPHQSTANTAVRDSFRTFTHLTDERIFIVQNGLGVLAYQRAAHALRAIPAMGVSHPMTAYLLDGARSALEDVLRFNRELADTLDAERFFLNVRPYFAGHDVGGVTYRGLNAGDFAAINEIDLLLGLDAGDAFYQQVMVEKYPFLPPADQELLRAASLRASSLLDGFLEEAADQPGTPQLRTNARLFLDVCQAHAAAYTFHHHRLVKPFLERPAASAPAAGSSSGPPLDVVIAGLARISDLRGARDRPGHPTARARLDRLRSLVSG
ncbi:monodechloroaminopyrrolnitrin synthase PrnB family protein [Pseudonocardia sp. TRM90224]|uniref:monodechloroaminopyrrolnitrin synthase PrnB family protein n=1 Tax=Pseudonocardia sp. TRM90224 TaxID=2812678 RepID=UPI001E33275E|nr:monodechloroaminopyrrolnitrin synthase PrnB family protein [Pseudonocardia sp. TRM90224]